MLKSKARWRPGAYAIAALLSAGCAATGLNGGSDVSPAPTGSVRTVEYYPYQVKGYQDSFPHRTMIVLLPTDARDVTGPDMAPNGDGQPAVGVVTNQSENVVEHLYSQPLPPIVQGAVARSAEEAGFSPRPDDASRYVPGVPRNADYVLTTSILRCWVKKHRGPDGHYGPTWSTDAVFAIEVTLYKPPFSVPFWQGTSNQEYFDPPIGSFGLSPDDEAGVYDDPGQVLSVAMTRAVAGVFQRDDLRALVREDHMVVR